MTFQRQGALLVAAMLTTLFVVCAGAIQRFAPGWQAGYLAAAVLLVALEACVLQHVAQRERMWLGEWSRYALPELLLMIVIMRVATTLGLGVATLAQDARRWLYDPLSIFDLPFLLALLLGVAVTYLAHTAMHDLGELSPRSFDTPGTVPPNGERMLAVITEDRSAALRRINSRFVIGGVLVLLALGVAAVNTEEFAGQSVPVTQTSAIGALVYVISGFLLYSQGRLALLRSRWRMDGATVAPAVVGRWTRTSWLIIGGVALLAALLPRTYGMGLLDTVRSMLGLVGYAIAVFGYVVVWLFGMLALIPAWLLSLFASPGQNTAPPPPPPVFTPPAPAPAVAQQPNLLATSLFWVCMVLLAVYALWVVVQRHPGLARALTHNRLFAWLAQHVGSLWRGTRSWTEQAVATIGTQLRRPAAQRRAQRQWLRLRQLPPRELVRYFYRSTLQRAASQGVPRRASQTPNEYRATLASRLPDAEPDIAALTDAFVAAEYGPRPVDETTAQRARPPWERLRQHLRAMLSEREQE